MNRGICRTNEDDTEVVPPEAKIFHDGGILEGWAPSRPFCPEFGKKYNYSDGGR